MKILFVFVWVAVNSLCMHAYAQTGMPEPDALACPLATELQVQDLFGPWRAEFSDPASGEAMSSAMLRFEQNPEFAQSVAGTITRGDIPVRVSGDVEDGRFALDESQDGTTISATWSGDVVPDTCGKEIRGTWTDTIQKKELNFVLRRLSE